MEHIIPYSPLGVRPQTPWAISAFAAFALVLRPVPVFGGLQMAAAKWYNMRRPDDLQGNIA